MRVSGNLQASNLLPSLYDHFTKEVTGVSKPGDPIDDRALAAFLDDESAEEPQVYREARKKDNTLAALLGAKGATLEKVKELDTALGEAGPGEIDAAGGARGFLEMFGKGLVDTFNKVEPFLPEISAASYKGPGFGINYRAEKPGKKGTRTARLGGVGSLSADKLKKDLDSQQTMTEKVTENLLRKDAEEAAKVSESRFDKRDIAAVTDQAATEGKSFAGAVSVKKLNQNLAKDVPTELANMPPDGGGGLTSTQVASLGGARDELGEGFVRQQSAGITPSATGRQIELVRTPQGLMQRVNGVLRPLGPGVYDTMGGTANV